MAKQEDWRDDKKGDVSDLAYQDSWKQNSVEIAALAALMLGGASMAANGHAGDIVNAAKKTTKLIGKRMNSYLNSSLSPTARLLKNVGILTAKKLPRYEGKQTEFSPELVNKYLVGAGQAMNPAKIQEEAIRRYSRDYRAAEDAHRFSGSTEPFVFDRTPESYLERVRDEEFRNNAHRESGGYFNSPFLPRQERSPGKGGPTNEQRIGPGSTFMGSALAGLGLGAGITAFHAADRAIRQLDHKQDHRNRERSYGAAGSFIKEDTMDKRANYTTHAYKSLAALASRTPQAIATGLGYTGVTLGTAELLKKHPELLHRPSPIPQEEQTDPSGSRIIIELGDDAATPDSYGGYGMTPKVAGSAGGLAKLATFGSFLKNVAGRHPEMDMLNGRISGDAVNYRDEAAQLLRGANIPAIAKEQYGNLVNEQNQKDWSKEILDSAAQKIRQGDIEQRNQLEADVARDRLRFGGGLAGLAATGATGAALTHHHRKDEDHG